MALDPEFKAKWVAALRSGEFKQTHGRLKSEAGHCCIGVLCHLAKRELATAGVNVVESDNDIKVSWGQADDEYCEVTELPCNALKLIGLTADQQNELINMNDGNPALSIGCFSFPQIASYIEASL